MNGEEKILAAIENLSAKVDNLTTKVERLETEVAELKVEVSELKVGLEDVRGRVILIERDHGEMLGAVLDGYHMLYDISIDMRSDMGKLNQRNLMHDAQIFKMRTSKLKTLLAE